MSSQRISGRSAGANHEPKQPVVLRLMMILRVVVVTALLGSALYVQLFYGLTSDSLYFIIGLTYLLTIFYSVLAGPLARSRSFLFVQLLFDVLLVSLLVLVTGAVESAFIILYYLLVAVAAVILGAASSISLAVVASAAFAAMGLLVNGGAVDLSILYPYAQPPFSNLLYSIGLNVFALGILAALSGYLAGMLKRTAASLSLRTEEVLSLRLLNESIVRSIGSGIITTDMDGRITFANPAAQRLTGSSRERLMKRDFHSFLEYNPDAPDPILEEESWSREMLLCRREGSKIDVGVSRTLLTGPNMRLFGKLYVIQDLRELKRLQEQLRMKDRMAAAGELSAAIAHEIRNPLGAISGSAQMIRKSTDLSAENYNYMSIIIRESERLSKILNSFLSSTRGPIFAPVPVDLAEIAKKTVMLLRNSTEVSDRHEIEFECSTDGELVARADPNMVAQLIYNLASNGLHAMADGGKLQIRLGLVDGEGSDYALLRVRDEGIGIAEDQFDRLFQPFTRGASGGVGLGMAIVYNIVKEHGGRIEVTSSPQKGTRVDVTLPLSGGEPEGFSVKVQAGEP